MFAQLCSPPVCQKGGVSERATRLYRCFMSADARRRAVDKIARLAGEPKDLATFWQECGDVVGQVVRYFWTPCWYTLDPASLLITSHYHPGMEEFPAEWLAAEYYADDVNKIADVALSPSGISTLYEATGGNPASSPRWHANMSLGGDQELITRLRTRSGDVWGALGLYREPDTEMFNESDKQFLQAISAHLAEGARRALLVGEAADPECQDGPGLIILDATWHVQSATPGVDRWLDELPDGDAGRLPSAVLAVAGRAMRAAENPDEPSGLTLSRVLSRTGIWIVLHAARLIDDGAPRVAIIIEPAHPARIYPLLMAAYRLTEREQDITRLVLQGASTAQIAEELTVSTHTVQQHLKSVFDKTGVRSRRELAGRIFFTHYEPRFRDNERRVVDGRPMRGGPALG